MKIKLTEGPSAPLSGVLNISGWAIFSHLDNNWAILECKVPLLSKLNY